MNLHIYWIMATFSSVCRIQCFGLARSKCDSNTRQVDGIQGNVVKTCITYLVCQLYSSSVDVCSTSKYHWRCCFFHVGHCCAQIIDTKSDCISQNLTWKNSPIHFDHVGHAYLALFQVVSISKTSVTELFTLPHFMPTICMERRYHLRLRLFLPRRSR